MVEKIWNWGKCCRRKPGLGYPELSESSWRRHENAAWKAADIIKEAPKETKNPVHAKDELVVQPERKKIPFPANTQHKIIRNWMRQRARILNIRRLEWSVRKSTEKKWQIPWVSEIGLFCRQNDSKYCCRKHLYSVWWRAGFACLGKFPCFYIIISW